MSETNDDQVHEYESQLAAVEAALKNAQGVQLTDLLDLKSKLQEVIYLLKGNQSSDEASSDSRETNDKSEKVSIDDEFARFQMEITELDRNSEKLTMQYSEKAHVDDGSVVEPNQELSEVLASLEGSKCRAPFSQPWGEKGYHNAMIISADYDPDSLQTIDDVEVRVMFCNPLCDQMKPCSFFLNGHCKFSDDRCRYSHGHKVNFSELQEFVLPDFSCLTIDAKCLAKNKDDLWLSATVEKCLGEQKYMVKYDQSGKADTLDVHNILPLDNSSVSLTTDETNFYSVTNDYIDYLNNEESKAVSSDTFNTSSPVIWEQHTKGIGSRLMEKMGHVWGQGLGKNSDGRLEPVEAIILPAGKSLDKCIEMREKLNPKGPIAIETRLSLEQDKEEQRAKKVKLTVQRERKKTIFDFINSKVSKINNDGRTLDIRKDQKNSDLEKVESNKSLNLQIFAVGEDIKKARRELNRLQQSLDRNSDRNEAIRSKVEKKMAVQNDILQRLQAKERSINKTINSQTSHKKLTIF